MSGALLPLLFPDGRPVSPRWPVAIWAAYGYIALATVGNGPDPASLEGVGAGHLHGQRDGRPVEVAHRPQHPPGELTGGGDREQERQGTERGQFPPAAQYQVPGRRYGRHGRDDAAVPTHRL